MNAKADASWTAETDYRDATAKGGYGRTTLAEKVERGAAELALFTALANHKRETGHTPGRVMEFPGKTHVSCSCRQTFVATKVG